jgi:hypothetical protein
MTPTATPVIEPTKKPAQPDNYFIDGTRLFRRHEGEDILVYDAVPNFPSGWDCWLENVVTDEDAVYFTEGGMLGDEFENSAFRIIRIDRMDRTVLYETTVIGFTQLVPYGDRIFFVQDGFDSQDIGWVSKDGNEWAWLDFTDYAKQYDVEPYYNGARLYMENGTLYADIAFFTDYDPEIVDHTVSIGKDLSIERADR